MALGVDMADSANVVKTIVAKIEDSRLSLDATRMRNHLITLNSLNRDLLAEYENERKKIKKT